VDTVPLRIEVEKAVGSLRKSTFLDESSSSVRCGSHWGGSPQNGLGDEQTCGMTLASAYMLHYLFTAWSQLQMIERSLR